MISVIVCSKDEFQFSRFSQSLEVTIGCQFEIIKIDNSVNRHSIAQAYNTGAICSRFEYLVFVHEDIVFHTEKWGKKLIRYFEDLFNPGVLGFAGSSYLPISPSDWWLSNSKYLYANFLSGGTDADLGDGRLEQVGVQKPQPVFNLDGMFLAMKKSIWQEFSFDESLEGFHGYDTSICYRVSRNKQNYFVPDILLEHFSKGNPNWNWLINSIKANEAIQPYKKELRKRQLMDSDLEIKTYHLFLNQLAKFSNNYLFNVSLSTSYLLELMKCFFSVRLLYIWLGFQVVFLLNSFKK